MLYSKKYRLVPAMTIQNLEEARERERDAKLGAILENRETGSGEKMAAYEDAFIRKKNSDATSKRRSRPSVEQTKEREFEHVQRDSEPAVEQEGESSSRSSSPESFVSSTALSQQSDSVLSDVSLSNIPNNAREISYRQDVDGRSRKRIRVDTPYPRVKHSANTPIAAPTMRETSSVSPKASAWHSSLKQALMKNESPHKSRVFRGRLDVTPRSVITPSTTRNGVQFGNGRMRIPTW